MLRQVEMGLKRSLNPMEKNLLAWPKMCSVCLDYDASILDPCDYCNAAWFCHEQHRENQVLEVHSPDLCNQLRLYYSLVVVGEST